MHFEQLNFGFQHLDVQEQYESIPLGCATYLQCFALFGKSFCSFKRTK